MTVTFAAMYDPDTEDRTEAFDAIETYEWAISDGQYVGGLYEKWNVINNVMKINTTHVSKTFIIYHYPFQSYLFACLQIEFFLKMTLLLRN